MDEIFDSISNKFPRLKTEIIKKLTFDIRMVCLGIKPSLLVDVVSVDENLPYLEALITEINNESKFQSIEAKKLKILMVKDDLFIVNFPVLLRTIGNKKQFIDVSSKIAFPALITDPSVRNNHG